MTSNVSATNESIRKEGALELGRVEILGRLSASDGGAAATEPQPLARLLYKNVGKMNGRAVVMEIFALR